MLLFFVKFLPQRNSRIRKWHLAKLRARVNEDCCPLMHVDLEDFGNYPVVLEGDDPVGGYLLGCLLGEVERILSLHL